MLYSYHVQAEISKFMRNGTRINTDSTDKNYQFYARKPKCRGYDLLSVYRNGMMRISLGGFIRESIERDFSYDSYFQ